MTITQLTYFVMVAQTGHFSVAADKLFISQSTLSYGIKELEKELDVQLFTRNANKKVNLTAYGRRFLKYAEKTLDTIEQGKNEIKKMSASMEGHISMCLFFSSALTTLPYLAREFANAYPEYHIHFEFDINHRWVALEEVMEKKDYDFCISSNPDIKNFNSLWLGSQRAICIVPTNHPFATRNKIRIKDLAEERIIAIDPHSNLDHFIHDLFQKEGLEPNLKYVSDWTAQIITSSLERCIAISCDHPVDETLFKKIPIACGKDYLDLYLLWSKKKQPSASAQLFIDYFTKRNAPSNCSL